MKQEKKGRTYTAWDLHNTYSMICRDFETIDAFELEREPLKGFAERAKWLRDIWKDIAVALM